jgi:uncharacterized protein (UPF0276 family)
MNASRPKFLGFGLGLRTQHYSYIQEHKPAVDWFEIISENFMIDGGRPLMHLDRLRRDYKVVMHGVSMSLGSHDPLNQEYFKRLKELIRRVEPVWVSDHLCWTGVHGRNAHDLLPLPYTKECLNHVVARIQAAQDILGCRIAVENPSSYIQFTESTMSEWDFLAEMARLADCGLLLDINNIFVSAFNHEFDAYEYLRAIPVERVWQFHLAGHQDHGTHLLDTHDHAVRAEVWEMFDFAWRRFGPVSTMIEWDDKIPEFPVLLAELNQAKTRAAAMDGAVAWT